MSFEIAYMGHGFSIKGALDLHCHKWWCGVTTFFFHCSFIFCFCFFFSLKQSPMRCCHTFKIELNAIALNHISHIENVLYYAESSSSKQKSSYIFRFGTVHVLVQKRSAWEVGSVAEDAHEYKIICMPHTTPIKCNAMQKKNKGKTKKKTKLKRTSPKYLVIGNANRSPYSFISEYRWRHRQMHRCSPFFFSVAFLPVECTAGERAIAIHTNVRARTHTHIQTGIHIADAQRAE